MHAFPARSALQSFISTPPFEPTDERHPPSPTEIIRNRLRPISLVIFRCPLPTACFVSSSPISVPPHRTSPNHITSPNPIVDSSPFIIYQNSPCMHLYCSIPIHQLPLSRLRTAHIRTRHPISILTAILFVLHLSYPCIACTIINHCKKLSVELDPYRMDSSLAIRHRQDPASIRTQSRRDYVSRHGSYILHKGRSMSGYIQMSGDEERASGEAPVHVRWTE